MSKHSKEKTQKMQQYNKDIFINMLCAVIVMTYFIILNILNYNCSAKAFEIYTKASCMLVLAVSIIIIEISYKKNNIKMAIYGLEGIIIAIYILLIETITTTFNFKTNTYIVFSSYIFPIYYSFKSIMIQTKETRKELKQMSDIKEIVKKEKPSKKVAKKRRV